MPLPARGSPLRDLLSLGTCLALALPTTLHAAPKPNILFILTDDQAEWAMGCSGNPDARTPHLDRLAREGTRFTQAYSACTVCSPTRAALLTGMGRDGAKGMMAMRRAVDTPEAAWPQRLAFFAPDLRCALFPENT